MTSFMRVRSRYLFVFVPLVLLLLALTDPDTGHFPPLPFGGAVVAWLLSACKGALYAALAHFTVKACADYPEADGQALFALVQVGNVAAAVALLGRTILMVGAMFMFAGQAGAAQGVPARAAEHLPTVRAELDAHWPGIPMRHYLPGLIEHESCITLTHPRCWSSTSRLKTAREEGAGLGQLTRAWAADGRLRFDALAEMRARHPSLAALDWSTIYARPVLQIRAVVLKVREDFEALAQVTAPLERLAMADAAYNGGRGGVQAERRACGLTRGCDPQRWWGHVERTCLKSRAALYAGRSACTINRAHVSDVLLARAPKYRALV